ncbi:MAG: hypothetical protein ABII01_07280 [Candidatus Woesearchaeota archaeon]
MKNKIFTLSMIMFLVLSSLIVLAECPPDCGDTAAPSATPTAENVPASDVPQTPSEHVDYYTNPANVGKDPVVDKEWFGNKENVMEHDKIRDAEDKYFSGLDNLGEHGTEVDENGEITGYGSSDKFLRGQFGFEDDSETHFVSDHMTWNQGKIVAGVSEDNPEGVQLLIAEGQIPAGTTKISFNPETNSFVFEPRGTEIEAEVTQTGEAGVIKLEGESSMSDEQTQLDVELPNGGEVQLTEDNGVIIEGESSGSVGNVNFEMPAEGTVSVINSPALNEDGSVDDSSTQLTMTATSIGDRPVTLNIGQDDGDTGMSIEGKNIVAVFDQQTTTDTESANTAGNPKFVSVTDGKFSYENDNGDVITSRGDFDIEYDDSGNIKNLIMKTSDSEAGFGVIDDISGMPQYLLHGESNARFSDEILQEVNLNSKDSYLQDNIEDYRIGSTDPDHGTDKMRDILSDVEFQRKTIMFGNFDEEIRNNILNSGESEGESIVIVGKDENDKNQYFAQGRDLFLDVKGERVYTLRDGTYVDIQENNNRIFMNIDNQNIPDNKEVFAVLGTTYRKGDLLDNDQFIQEDTYEFVSYVSHDSSGDMSISIDKQTMSELQAIAGVETSFALLDRDLLANIGYGKVSFMRTSDFGIQYQEKDNDPVTILSTRDTQQYLGHDLPTLTRIVQRGIGNDEQGVNVNRLGLTRMYQVMNRETDGEKYMENLEEIDWMIELIPSDDRHSYRAAFLIDAIPQIPGNKADRVAIANKISEARMNIENFGDLLNSDHFDPSQILDYLGEDQHQIGMTSSATTIADLIAIESVEDVAFRLENYLALTALEEQIGGIVDHEKRSNGFRVFMEMQNIDSEGNYEDTGPSINKIVIMQEMALELRNGGEIANSMAAEQQAFDMISDLRDMNPDADPQIFDQMEEAHNLFVQANRGGNLNAIDEALIFRRSLMDQIIQERKGAFERIEELDPNDEWFMAKAIFTGGYGKSLAFSDENEAIVFANSVDGETLNRLNGMSLIKELNKAGVSGDNIGRFLNGEMSEVEVSQIVNRVAANRIVEEENSLFDSYSTREVQEFMENRRQELNSLGTVIRNPDISVLVNNDGSPVSINGFPLNDYVYDQDNEIYLAPDGTSVTILDIAEEYPEVVDEFFIGQGRPRLIDANGKMLGDAFYLTTNDQQEVLNDFRELMPHAQEVYHSEEFGNDLRSILGIYETVPMEEGFGYANEELNIDENLQNSRSGEMRQDYAMSLFGSEKAANFLNFVDEGVSIGTVTIAVATGGIGGSIISPVTTGARGAVFALAEDRALDAGIFFVLDSFGADVHDPLLAGGTGIALALTTGNIRSIGALRRSASSSASDAVQVSSRYFDDIGTNVNKLMRGTSVNDVLARNLDDLTLNAHLNPIEEFVVPQRTGFSPTNIELSETLPSHITVKQVEGQFRQLTDPVGPDGLLRNYGSSSLETISRDVAEVFPDQRVTSVMFETNGYRVRGDELVVNDKVLNELQHGNLVGHSDFGDEIVANGVIRFKQIGSDIVDEYNVRIGSTGTSIELVNGHSRVGPRGTGVYFAGDVDEVILNDVVSDVLARNQGDFLDTLDPTVRGIVDGEVTGFRASIGSGQSVEEAYSRASKGFGGGTLTTGDTFGGKHTTTVVRADQIELTQPIYFDYTRQAPGIDSMHPSGQSYRQRYDSALDAYKASPTTGNLHTLEDALNDVRFVTMTNPVTGAPNVGVGYAMAKYSRTERALSTGGEENFIFFNRDGLVFSDVDDFGELNRVLNLELDQTVKRGQSIDDVVVGGIADRMLYQGQEITQDILDQTGRVDVHTINRIRQAVAEETGMTRSYAMYNSVDGVLDDAADPNVARLVIHNGVSDFPGHGPVSIDTYNEMVMSVAKTRGKNGVAVLETMSEDGTNGVVRLYNDYLPDGQPIHVRFNPETGTASQYVPLGMRQDEFVSFSSRIDSELDRLVGDIPRDRVRVVGSSITGKSTKTGDPFIRDPTHDYDVSIIVSQDEFDEIAQTIRSRTPDGKPPAKGFEREVNKGKLSAYWLHYLDDDKALRSNLWRLGNEELGTKAVQLSVIVEGSKFDSDAFIPLVVEAAS